MIGVEAVAVYDFGCDLVIRGGAQDPAAAARRVSGRCRKGQRVLVHAVSTPAWSNEAPVHLLALFEVIAPGAVRWVFAQAGGDGSGD